MRLPLAATHIIRQNSEAFKDACYAFSKLWDSQTCLFLRQPTLTALHSVVQILAFGMTLAKLVPETYMKNLHILSVKLKKIGLKLQSSGLIPKAHFFSIRDVVDLSPSKMLCMIGDLLPHEPYPVLGILDQLVYIFPAFIMDESTLSKIIEILMRAIRVSSQDNCDIDCETKASAEISEEPSVLALDIFVRLVDTLSSHGSKLTDLSRILLQLFDLLRAFPNTLAHSEARLHAWWHFICCLPSDLLSDGFRKFLSPFLANLLGRYLSISAPQGSSQFHPYKLSQGSVHEGNVKALELIQHVYSCFFDESSVTFHHLNVPRLSVSSQLLVQNSYPILVSLLYWIRVVSKYRHSSTPKKLKIPSHCLPSQTVDEIWFGCINHLLKISKPLDGLPVHKKITPFQSPSLSVHVSSPNSPLLLTVWQNVKTVTCELIRPSALSLSSDPEIMISSPSPMESLNIIHKLMQLLEEFKLPDKEKVDLVSSLCLKSAELGGSWLKEIPKPKSLHATKDDFHRWATLTIRLIDLDPRLNISNTSVMTRGLRFTGENNFLGLIRALVAALLPDFVDFITSRSPSESSLYDDSTQPLAYKNPKVYFSPTLYEFGRC
ncbi:unnamed protein product [Heterobilharzia americana]|nr:unnamed protein product [Heterobilharzia americana]